MKDAQILRQHTFDVRRACEQFTQLDAARDMDYYKSKSLASMCAVASFSLCEYLRAKGIEDARVAIGDYREHWGWWERECHCWVRSGPYIIDITTTQFGVRNKVVMTRNPHRHYPSLCE